MYYLLTYDVEPDYLKKREAHRDEHLKLAQAACERGELRLGGALTEPTLGAALVFEGASPNVAEEFAKNDPYVRHGLVKNWHVNEWAIVIGAGIEPI
ncbi:YCII-related protein [Paraglaciecola sp. T6c]|uniref:YciI-like protein n=1 Tax=Pseudoalteromonas atlantica (strain T6c / ATCC BAA-1087) TaxID=3042615 RepID=UPI00005C51E3|nr:YciI-like protein [Paraglaciecola sp. T6c]ABG40374.1 YCII-related protein [Paraglaciecola sp. T6c]